MGKYSLTEEGRRALLEGRPVKFILWAEGFEGTGCAAPRRRNRQAGYVYLIEGGGYHKIGRTKDPVTRIPGINMPFPTQVVCVIPTEDMRGLEQDLHRRFADKRVHGEWFTLDPADVAYIRRLA